MTTTRSAAQREAAVDPTLRGLDSLTGRIRSLRGEAAAVAEGEGSQLQQAKAARRLLRSLCEARRLLAATLLAEGYDAEQVRLAAEVSWSTLASWCFDKNKCPVVPEDVLEEVIQQEEQARREREATANRRRRGRGEQLTDDDTRARAREEEVRILKKDYESMAKEDYEPGYDLDLDAKIALLEHWDGA